MNPLEMVVIIVAIVTVGRVLSGRNAHRRERGQSGIIQADPDAARMREEIKTLKDRIAVLERLATDTNSSIALDREIEKLR